MLEEPKTTTAGVFTAAAMCAMPLSLPMNNPSASQQRSQLRQGKISERRTGVSVFSFNSSMIDF